MYTGVVVGGAWLGLVWWAVDRATNGFLNMLARVTADQTERDDPLPAGDPTPEQAEALREQCEACGLARQR
jgi:hypothetical protein